MQLLAPVIINDHALQDLAFTLRENNPSRVILVEDENTRTACGWVVEEILREVGLPIIPLVLPGIPRVSADETSMARVLQVLNGEEAVLIAVGSGTITDIVRFTAFQTRLPFYSVPTAASVDAYASYTAAITIADVKYSFGTKTAAGVFAHLPTIRAAPTGMTAAGFSDMVAKYTGLADWALARILVDDEYDLEAARLAAEAVGHVAAEARGIGVASLEGIRVLVEGLIDSGHCMVRVKSSRPAAGSEHSLAHFWEIKHQLEGLPESMHGEKTGVGTVLISQLYANLRRLSRREARQRLEKFSLPDPLEEIAEIKAAYGSVAEALIASRPSFLGQMRGKAAQVSERLISRWEEVQTIAETVPAPEAVSALLERAGALNQLDQIHVSDEEANLAIQHAMYVRDRFTILELNRFLNLSSL